MGRIIKKIVLTGGPCAGKTTALTKLEKDLSEKGYRVFIVPESATELIKGGIRPFGDCVNLLDFQRIILDYQLKKENTYQQAARFLGENEKCVILYDRGAIDNKAYIGSKRFKQLVEEQGYKELDLLDNYDMVLHLTTAADGAEQFYTLANNEARTESIDEALELDKKTRNAWLGHSNLKIINNSNTFDEKLEIVLDEINNALGNPISLKKQHKYLIDLDHSDLSFLSENNGIEIDIKQTYLVNSISDDSCEVRLRKRTIEDSSTYHLTQQKKGFDGTSKVVTEERISRKKYKEMLSLTDNILELNKTRHSFIYNKQYFRLDIFKDNMAILEIEPTKQNKKITIPEQFSILKEVTSDKEYNNYQIASNIQAKKQIKKIGS